MRIAAVLCVTLALSGCLGEELEEPTVSVRGKSICGPPPADWQDVELYDGALGTTVAFVNEHQKPVGMLKWRSDLAARYTNPGNVNGSPWCTGTLITPELMITAGHCFDVDGGFSVWPRVNGTGQPITSQQGALEMLVDFNYQLASSGAPRTPQSVAITQLVEYRLGGQDYAVIRLSGSPGATFGTTTISPFVLATGAPITIIQHPDGLPKKVHAGPIAGMSTDGMLTYGTADTIGGSSGSGVQSNLTGYITAVHVEAGCTATGGANRGTPVSSIYPVSASVRLAALDAAKIVSVLF
jgi:V8-like Glu-specific endopeptidase